jgi:hypothetical protein
MMGILGVVMWAAGDGLEPALQSLIVSFIEKDHNARVFTTVTVLETSGKVLGGPLMATLFSIGLRNGGWWSGLCFLVSSVSFPIPHNLNSKFLTWDQALFTSLAVTAWRYKLNK